MPGKQHSQQHPPIETELTVGQVAASAGVAISTLHFYESKGLIHSWRNAGNQRRYAREVLRRVAVIKVAQRTGIPLAEIQAALSALPENRTPTAADWKKLSRAASRSIMLMPPNDCAAACGTLGAFVMQALKRDAGVFHWGNRAGVTGAVGLLDRIAPLCFAAPVFFHSVRWYFKV